MCIHFFPELIQRRCGVFLSLNDARLVVVFQRTGTAAALEDAAVGDFFDNAKALHQGDDFFYIQVVILGVVDGVVLQVAVVIGFNCTMYSCRAL